MVSKGDYPGRENAVARLVRDHRERKGWSQEQLALAMNELGVDWKQPTVSRIENGRRHLSLVETMKLTDVLGIDRGTVWLRDIHHESP